MLATSLHKIINFSALENSPQYWGEPDKDWQSEEGLQRIVARGPLYVHRLPWGNTHALQPGYSYCGVCVSDLGHWGKGYKTKYGCGLIQRTIDLVKSIGCEGGYHGHLCDRCMVWENKKLEADDEIQGKFMDAVGDVLVQFKRDILKEAGLGARK